MTRKILHGVFAIFTAAIKAPVPNTISAAKTRYTHTSHHFTPGCVSVCVCGAVKGPITFKYMPSIMKIASGQCRRIFGHSHCKIRL